MKDILKAIWDFPAHHVSLGWWLAALLTLWNVIASVSGRAISQVLSLGRKFRKSQLIARIHTLEYLHENTNALMRHLATDFVEVAIEISAILILFSVLLFRLLPATTARGSAMFAIIGSNVGTNVIGRAWRIRILLRDLNAYPGSVEILKKKLNSLNT